MQWHHLIWTWTINGRKKNFSEMLKKLDSIGCEATRRLIDHRRLLLLRWYPLELFIFTWQILVGVNFGIFFSTCVLTCLQLSKGTLVHDWLGTDFFTCRGTVVHFFLGTYHKKHGINAGVWLHHRTKENSSTYLFAFCLRHTLCRLPTFIFGHLLTLLLRDLVLYLPRHVFALFLWNRAALLHWYRPALLLGHLLHHRLAFLLRHLLALLFLPRRLRDLRNKQRETLLGGQTFAIDGVLIFLHFYTSPWALRCSSWYHLSPCPQSIGAIWVLQEAGCYVPCFCRCGRIVVAAIVVDSSTVSGWSECGCCRCGPRGHSEDQKSQKLLGLGQAEIV